MHDAGRYDDKKIDKTSYPGYKYGKNISSLLGKGKDQFKALGDESDAENLSTGDETTHSIKRLFKSYYNLALIFGTVGVKNIVDYIGKTVLNTDDLSTVSQDAAITELKDKLDKVESIVKDEETKKAFGKASKALGELVSVFISEAKEPLTNVAGKLSLVGLQSMTVLFEQSMNSLEDAITLIPMLGDGYVILQNMIDISKSASNTSQGFMKVASDVSDMYKGVSENLGINSEYSENKLDLTEALKDIQKIVSQTMSEASLTNENLTNEYALSSTNRSYRDQFDDKKEEQVEGEENKEEEQVEGKKNKEEEGADKKEEVTDNKEEEPVQSADDKKEEEPVQPADDKKEEQSGGKKKKKVRFTLKKRS